MNCATGNYSEAQTDLSVGGRGVGLDLTRTYNAQAGAAGIHGVFGYGWSSSFSDHLVVEKANKAATLYQANGSTVPFTEGSGGSYTAPEWSQDTLTTGTETRYTVTLADQTKYQFKGSSGRLESVTDRNGNATTLTYGEAGRLEAITDPAGRKVTFKYNGEGLVESAKDPLGHVVKYTYEGGNLASVTEPGESSARWQFKYDGSHRMTTMTDGRGGKTTNEYNSENQVISQTDPAERTLTFEYEPFHTKITNHATGAVTDEHFTSNYEPVSITRGFETASATTETFSYNEAGEPLTITDGNGHTTEYGYDAAGDRTSMIDPDKHETKWTYDATHDVETVTAPGGETTTIKRDAHGNAEKISRPAPGGKTQATEYTYDSHGNLTSVTNPLKSAWKYVYDNAGDRTAETDAEANKRTWGYNEDSQETSIVSPRGHVKGAEETKFTTKIERDERGRPVKVTDPLGHATKYAYDANGNVESVTDPNSHKTKYTYNADNEAIKVERPNGTVVETGYDGAGQVTSQTDGNKHVTKYVRNAVEEATEVIDPLGRRTTKEYDNAGNLTSVKDAAKRTATYKYDPANRLTEITYSDGKTHAVAYEYNADGDRTAMTDGTGKTTYEYDQLDRLIEGKDGHGDTSKYEYDLANQVTKITYPNGKAVTRTYDRDGRLEKVSDWLSHTTKFAYNPDSAWTVTSYGSGTREEDEYAYNEADQMSEVKMVVGAETRASIGYTRDSDGQVKSATVKGLPGEEKPSYTYDSNNRLTKGGGGEWEYDAADNHTKIGTRSYAYNAADEIETRSGFTYNEVGERTKASPTKGAATSFGYDQAGNLTSVTRPAEGETRTAINDTYGYDGNGLRASQTIGATTTYMTWEVAEGPPMILNDGTNSYIYGPDDIPIEQLNGEGKVLFLHHDQQGSTRMLTATTGATEAKMTYDPYGNLTGSSGSATTPLGYAGQYTSADTGLIYLRARTYDPATAQFLSVDPLAAITQSPYGYAQSNPLNLIDPSGLCSFLDLACDAGTVGNAVAAGAEWASEHPVEALGIGAGVLSAGTGVGAIADVALLSDAGISTGALATTSVVAGAVGTAIDGNNCLNGAGDQTVACVGFSLNAVGGGLGVGAMLMDSGLIEGSAALQEGLEYGAVSIAGLGLDTDLYGLTKAELEGAAGGEGPSEGELVFGCA